jgi:hypothetical protein
MYGILLIPMNNTIKLLFPMIVLVSLSIATLDIDNGLSKINSFQVSTIPILNYALAQEDADEDAEDAEDAETAEEDATGEEGVTPTPTPAATPTPTPAAAPTPTPAAAPTPTSNSTASFTISRIMEGNASMLTSNLPLIKRMIVSDITDIEGLAPKNGNQTLRESALIIDEIDNTNQSVSRSATIKSLVSSELGQAISVLTADRENETLRLAVDNQVQCTPAPAPVPGNGGPATPNNPTCIYTIRIHQ